MKHQEFYIGLQFVSSGGLKWQCTDIGTRTIVAMRPHPNDPIWNEGPPYVLQEVVFDEKEMERCYLSEGDAIEASAFNMRSTGHPGYPSEVVIQMLEAACVDEEHRYPTPGALRFDRLRNDGEILHPYAGGKGAHGWMIELYLPFLGTFDRMAERDFIALPMAQTEDIKTRARRKG